MIFLVSSLSLALHGHAISDTRIGPRQLRARHKAPVAVSSFMACEIPAPPMSMTHSFEIVD